MQSAFNKIKDKILSSNRGELFFPDDFSSLGSSDAVRSALVRLCQSGLIICAAQGIYYYPKMDTKWRSGIIPPSIEEIANGIAKRDKVWIKFLPIVVEQTIYELTSSEKNEGVWLY